MNDWIDFLGIILDSVLSAAAVVVSIVVFISNKKSNQTTFELGIYQMIQTAKINLDNKIYNLIDKDKDLEYVSTVINPPIETYLDTLNSACSLYFSKELNKKRFDSLYLNDITNIFSNKVYEKVLEESELYYLKKFYKEIIKNTNRR